MSERVSLLRERVGALDCDAFFSLAPPDNQYLTGFRTSFDEVSSGIVITRSDAVFITDSRYTEQADDQVRGYEIRQAKGELAEALGKALGELGAKRPCYVPSRLTVEALDQVAEAYGGELAQGKDVVSGLRIVKTAEEIDLIRSASRLAEGVLIDVKSALEGGESERATAARIEFCFKERGAEGSSFDTIALYGARSSLPHGIPGDRELGKGDTALFDLGCRKGGYCSDLTRTYMFGTIASSRMEEVYGVVLDAQLAALEAVRPGALGKEVDAAARNKIADAGYGDFFGHGVGHGVGVEIHESPRLNPRSVEALEPGMVVTVEPGIYLPDEGGVRIEDLVVVTAGGCERLSTSSKELEVLKA